MFVSTGKFIFEKLEERVSKGGNPFRLVHLIDTENYQRLEFFADNDVKVTCNEGQSCKVVLIAQKMGYSTSMNCLTVSPA